MKFTAIFLLAGALQVSARGYSQGITLSEKNAPLEKVFEAIKKQTGYSFLYTREMLQETKRVTIYLTDASIRTVLEECLKEQPLTYSILNNTIIIKPKEKKSSSEPIPDNQTSGPPTDIAGVVTDENGSPLSGAYVIIKGKRKGTVTDAQGKFLLTEISEKSVLVISFVGYAQQEMTIGKQTFVTAKMKLATNELDQVVIQGYGKTSNRLSTGDIATITAKEIEKQPVAMNPLMALQGRVAGLDIQQTSGYASAPIRAIIRGRSSVDPYQLPDPLYIVDGVPLTVLNIGKTNGYGNGFLQNPGLNGPAGGQSPLFSINTSDIESITVLKDADATSIYGSRGANGVILITTKSGKPGKTHLDLHVEEGVNIVTRYWQLLNTPQYLAMRREALRNDGLTPNASNAPDLLIWDTARYTDWQRALYGRAGKVITAEASLTGGDVHTTFRVSTSYSHSTEITTASGADKKASVSMSLTHHSSDQRFVVTLTNIYSFTQSDMVPLPGRISYAPNAPSIYDSSGKLNWKEWNAAKVFGSTGASPFGSLLQPYTAKTSFLNSRLVVSFQPFRAFTFSTSLGYSNAQSNQISLIPIASQDPANNPTGTSQFGNNSNKNWIIEPQISYNTLLGPGSINALIGGSLQGTTTDGIYIVGSGYNNDALLRTISNAPSQVSSENFSEYRYAAVFARLGYDIAHKYLLNLNARRVQ